MTPEEISEIKADVKRAHTEVGEICQRTGAGRWRMSIPARPERDSDLLISRGLTHADSLLAEVERLTKELEPLRATAETHHGSPSCSSVIDELRSDVERLSARLKAAEDLCVMYSWSAGRHVTNREKAAHELWRRWYGIVGSDFLTADAHPDLSDAMVDLLAAQRDETRARTLARIRSNAPTELPGGEG